MDDMAKKLLAQLDDDFPGVRANALDALRDHLKQAGQSFRDFLDAVPRAEHEKALSVNTQQAANIAKLTKDLASKTREAVVLRGVASVKLNWRPLVVLLAVPFALWAGYRWYINQDFPDDAGSDLHHVADQVAQNNYWLGKPFVADIRGKPYWLLLRATVDKTSFVDKTNKPVTMQCMHVFVGPAESESGQYRKPEPTGWFGGISWPERLVDCRTASEATSGKAASDDPR